MLSLGAAGTWVSLARELRRYSSGRLPPEAPEAPSLLVLGSEVEEEEAESGATAL